MKAMIELKCSGCGIGFERSIRQYNADSKNKNYLPFCSQSCSATMNNSRRKENGYTAKGKTKESKCVKCNIIVLVSKNAEHSKTLCNDCRKENYISCILNGKVIYKRIREFSCEKCNGPVFSIKRKKFCDTCYKEYNKQRGMVAGKNAAAVRVKRSKNEIHFFELCKDNFQNVTSNEQFFESKYGKWDADVIIHELKTAILWNGIWHYKKVRKDHNLEQVQSRDKIKMNVIERNGYEVYVIKDMGRENKKFVEAEFEKFKEHLRKKYVNI